MNFNSRPEEPSSKGNTPVDSQRDATSPAAAVAGRNARLSLLAQHVALRDEKALEELYALTVARVYSLALHVVGDPSTANEIVSDVYFQFWRDIDRYDAGRAAVEVWLLVLCRSRSLDALRRRDAEARCDESSGFERADSESGPEDSPPDLAAVTQRSGRLHAHIARLSAVERQLLGLAFFRGYTHEEIASRERMPLGTVKSCIRQALRKLREALEDRDS